MKNKARIFSLILLGIYSLVLFHNVVPHVHADGSSVSDAATHSHPSHHPDAHHHHHGAENSSDWLYSLLALLDGLSHQNLGPDHFENYVAQDVVKVSNKESFELFALPSVPFEGFELDGALAYASIDPPPVSYNSSFSLSAPLRGPPSVA